MYIIKKLPIDLNRSELTIKIIVLIKKVFSLLKISPNLIYMFDIKIYYKTLECIACYNMEFY